MLKSLQNVRQMSSAKTKTKPKQPIAEYLLYEVIYILYIL